MDITTMPPDRYHPLTPSEFSTLRELLSTIGHNLPEAHLPYIWETYLKLTSTSEPRPCSCQSAAPHWIRAISHLRDWTNQRV